ncbi:MAG: hypothetical protein AVDCRST_MAG55-1727, partial [uncultured Rubrobacteraceae bacterium]
GQGVGTGLRGAAGAGSGGERAVLRAGVRAGAGAAEPAGCGGLRHRADTVCGARARGGPRRGGEAGLGRSAVAAVRRCPRAPRLAARIRGRNSPGALRQPVRARLLIRRPGRLRGDGARWRL